MEYSESDLALTAPNSVVAANITCSNLIPEMSKEKYTATYNLFMEWHKQQKMSSFGENVILAYFAELSKKFKASTLWSQYSMLRMTVNINNNVDIAKYEKLRAFLKQKSDGYRPKKSKIFTSDEINKFIEEAPDKEYLLAKVVLIIGVIGACRRAELYNMKITDFKDLGLAVLVEVPNMKTKVARTFTITGRSYEIFKRYADLRPQNTNDPFFFLNYQKGKCTPQKVGINKFGNVGKQIATYLKLPNAESYTGHCFRRSSTIILGGDITTLRRTGSSSPEYIPSASTSRCTKTYERVGKVDVSPHGSNSDTNEEEFRNIANNSKITIKEEILPEIDTACEVLSTNQPTNNSISEYTFEHVDVNGDSYSKPEVVEIKKEMFVYPESLDNLLTSLTDNADTTDVSINKTEYESGDSFSEAAYQYNFESVPEFIPRCDIGTQTEEEISCTAESYFNLFVKVYFKEVPNSTSDAVKKTLEIDGYILKLIKCRQNMFDNFDKSDKCTNSLAVPERLPDTDAPHSATDLDVEESTTKRKPNCSCGDNSEVVACDEGTKTEGRSLTKIVNNQIVPERLPDANPLHSAVDSNVEESCNESIISKRKLDCGYRENSEVAACDEGTKTGGRSLIKIVNNQIVPERLPDADPLHSALDSNVDESIISKRKLDCGYRENSEVAACDEGTKTERSLIKIVNSQIIPERLPDADPLRSAVDSNVEESYNESIISKRKLDCGYRENSEVAACDEGTKTGGRSWRKTAKKRKCDNSELQGKSEIATCDETTENSETSNDNLHKEDSPRGSTCSVETGNNISESVRVPGCP